MAQRLRMPIDEYKPTAGYKNQAYKRKFGIHHFGLDGISTKGNTKLYALGNGTVIAAGLDGTNGVQSGCGYVLVIVYDDCINNKTYEVADQTVTYFHLAEQPAVKAGQKVTKKTFLGNYGATGGFVTGAHLHVQFDSDTKYPLHCTGIGKKSHAVLKYGNIDSTENPCDWLWLDKGQKITVSASSWYDEKQFKNIPSVTAYKPSQAADKSSINFDKESFKMLYKGAQTVKNRVDVKS